MNNFGDPYRIKKPKTGVLDKFVFSFGISTTMFGGAGSRTLYLTKDYVWLSTELAIPTASIRRITLINANKDIVIEFYHAIKNQDLTVSLFCPGIIGVAKKKNLALVERIQEIVKEAKPLDEFLLGGENGEAQMKIACEISGNPDARYVTTGVYFCFGVYPLAGAYGWEPRERYLSRKYAVRECMKCNLITSLIGYWGIPGIVLAPVKMWQNINSVRKAFGLSLNEGIKLMLISNLPPILLVITVVVMVLTAE